MLTVLQLAQYLITFGIPLLFLANPKFPKFPRTSWGKFVSVVLLVWLLAIIERVLSTPYRFQAAAERGDEMYDGVGGNVAVLFIGWMIGLIGSIPAFLVRAFVSKLQARQNSSPDFIPPSSVDPENPYSPPTTPPKEAGEN